MNRRFMSWLLMGVASISGLGACAVADDEDSNAMSVTAPGQSPLGAVLVSKNPPPPKCTDSVGPNQAFNCLAQTWGNVGTVEAMRDAANLCGCTAEIVTTNVVPEECNVKRVAAFCNGMPPFNAVSPIPAGDYTCTGLDADEDGEDDVVHVNHTDEPPFIGVHIDPENGGRLCDVSLNATGMADRTKIENCGGCHYQNEANWSPTSTTSTTTTTMEAP
jgi:hypothetical protein